MFKNYFTVAFRNLWRNKSFSAINIFGLAIGLAVCLLITLFVFDELSYDKFNVNADRIYRVSSDFKVNGSGFRDRESPAPMAGALMRECPKVEQATRLRGGGDVLVKKGTSTIKEPNCFWADANVFKVFTLPFINGNPVTALLQPHTIVISEQVARKYFNSIDVIGKTLHLDNTDDYKITGVIKNVPTQSHIHFNILRSMSALPDAKGTEWGSESFLTYVLLKEGAAQKDLDDYLKLAVRKYAGPELKRYMNLSIEDIEAKGDHFTFVTTPITKIHLFSTISELEPGGNIQYVYIFIVIAVVILLIACVNFMNLSTARSAGRSKEVGIRKVLGSGRGKLIYQFLTESTLTSFIALMIGIFFAALLLPYFNELAGKQITFSLFSSIWVIPLLLAVTVVIGLMAGSYPAFFMSAFQPIVVLKGKLSAGFKSSWLRNSLVVFQFVTVIVLIIGTMVIYSQLNYIRNRKLGYNREQVLIVNNVYSLYHHIKSFKEDVLRIPGVKSGTATIYFPTSIVENTQVYGREGSDASESLGLVTWNIDEDYIPTLSMQITTGRNFSKEAVSDSSAIIINETAATLLGFKDPLKSRLFRGTRENHATLNIIGVVKDFNFGSMRHKTAPLVLRLSSEPGKMAFRVNTKNLPSLISRIEALYHSADANMAGQPFEYSFMDDDFNHLYQSEQSTGKIFISFVFFAILIACLGLFGLVTYAAEQRTKEIGIRKVLGASVRNIVAMLSGDFLKLVGIAFFIAFPIAWYAMNNWLQGFAYRTHISWWIFALAGLAAVLITLTTVSFRAIKAALANPVRSLRSE